MNKTRLPPAFHYLQQFAQLQMRFTGVPAYPQVGGDVKIPAAWLIDQAGLKGQEVCGLTVHNKQALVLTNPNKLPVSAVLAASEYIVQTVFTQFGITLEREPQMLGNLP